MLIHEDITESIIGCFYKVYNQLGFGFLEKVYENALCLEMRKAGLNCLQQYPIKFYYNEVEVGNYCCDIIVEDKIILEVKVGKGEIPEPHQLQLQNYLRATRFEVGMILYFGEKPLFKRKVLSNNFK